MLTASVALLALGVLFWALGDIRSGAWVSCVGALLALRMVWRADR